MTSKEQILSRIRQALKRESPEPHWLHEPVGEEPDFPLPDSDPQSLLAAFQAELQSLFGEVHSFAAVEDANHWLHNEKFPTILAPECERLKPVLFGVPGVTWIPKDNPTRKGWEEFACGVTPTICLSAESGSLIVAADVSGRAMSVLPPVHVVVATMDQLLPDLDAAVKLVRKRYGEKLPSTLSVVTGPSRTADIEKILVLGAHGPKRLVVLMLPEGSLPALE
jgi:L-lactate dehydrogenase complex protein LldG